MVIKISVITITRNERESFINTAQSIISQTYKNFEWIVVDGGDDFASQSIIDNFADRIDVLVRGNDSGIADAWNKGISRSTCSHILLLNSGDSYSCNFIEFCFHCLQFNSLSILCFSASIISSSGRYIRHFRPRTNLLVYGMYSPHCWMCIPRYIYDSIGLYDNVRFSMDYLFIKKVINAYSLSIFQSVSTNASFGFYVLGGLSDNFIYKSMFTNLRINLRFSSPFDLTPYLVFVYIISRVFISRLFVRP